MERALFLPPGNLTETRTASLLEKQVWSEISTTHPKSTYLPADKEPDVFPTPSQGFLSVLCKIMRICPLFCDVEDVSWLNYSPCENTFYSRQMAAGWDNFSFSGNLKTYRDHMPYHIAYAMSEQPQSIFPCRNGPDFNSIPVLVLSGTVNSIKKYSNK